jgi:predicted RNA-binding protein
LLYWTGWRKRIDPLVASPSKNHVLRGLILYEEIIGMKFKENRVILIKVMNKYKVLCGIRNMKNIIKM